MPKQKKSFFEKLTGIQKVDEGENEEIQVTNNPASPVDEEDAGDQENEMYEFPDEEKNEFEEEDYENAYIEETDESFEPEDQEEEIAQPESKPGKKSALENEDEEVPADSEGQLTIDVYQTDKEIVIKSTIAGVKPEDLDVNINDEMVTIKGKRDQGEEVDPENYYYQECYWGPFSRTIILPVEIVTEKAEALMKNGILTIKLPKAESTKTRKLQVRGF
ncbi:MAG: Hsp20/alpha crystallin family protein [Candidatus Moranbacteria bacterium]|nr:Hsp20/alpha crystallin family protein [Candidatus Moranbacteria bacterium]